MVCKILGLFVNPLTADDKSSLRKRGNLLQHIDMPLSQKQNKKDSFFTISYLHPIFNIFKKRMILIADVFLNLQTPKNIVR